MAEAVLSTVARLTEFFSADQIEASARRTGFVQRASKIRSCTCSLRLIRQQ
jgi:hypothetical protein